MPLLEHNFSPGDLKEKSYIRLLLFVLLANFAVSQNIVKYLPGYDGPLPFKLETGYIRVDESELFYYFIESEGNPEEDPIFLWLTGGPGCSSFCALVYEIGPLEFDINNYRGGLPQLKYYPYAWTKTASIIFLEAPVGTGFSYSVTSEGWHSSDTKHADQAYQFLKKWLLKHPQYLPLQLIIGGDSYSGIVVPLIVEKVIQGNEKHAYPRLNIKGYNLGSPVTDEILNANSAIVFAHRMALISNELYKAMQTSCNKSYVNVDPSNTECITTLASYEKCIRHIETADILEPNCAFASGRTISKHGQRLTKENTPNFILSPPKIPDLWCRAFNYVLSFVWANDIRVQDALHVRKGKVLEWMRCNRSLSYTKDVQSVIDVHHFLTTKNMNILIYNGDRDMAVPIVATQDWVTSLNLSLDFAWAPWFVDGQVAGYWIKYSDHGCLLTFATIKGGGHVSPEWSRKQCYEMFRRWVHYYPL